MNRKDVLKKIMRAARAKGLSTEMREGGNHTRLRIGKTATTLGRHNEIHDQMARQVFKQLEGELGKGWWK
ncbi:MAG: hypothetical protein ACRDPW_01330 [Mycobacteriales bacterium]